LAEKFPTAALARFQVAEWLALGQGPAKLVAFLGPRDLTGIR
jgi:hypothetical protein